MRVRVAHSRREKKRKEKKVEEKFGTECVDVELALG